MKTISTYYLKTIKVIMAFRKLRNLTPLYLGSMLSMSEDNFDKFETGDKTLSTGQLKILAKLLGTDISEMMAIAEADEIIDFKTTPLSEIISGIQLMDGIASRINLPVEDLEFIVSDIKKNHLDF